MIRYKLIFFSPSSALEGVKAAIFATGAGTFPGGKYTRCCFESIGVGQFQPVAERGARPAIGEKVQQDGDGSGAFRLERVEEVRCEILCVGRETVGRAVEALKR